jgi:hypothetical protein
VIRRDITASGRPGGSGGVVQVRHTGAVIGHDGVIERQTAHTDIDEACAAGERLPQERG